MSEDVQEGPPNKRTKLDKESDLKTSDNIDFSDDINVSNKVKSSAVNEDKYTDFVNPEEVEKLREFKVLDEVKSNDEDSNEESDSSDEKEEEVSEEEIERMLDEDLPEVFKGAPKPKERPYSTRQKIILEEKGVNHFEVLPLDWMVVRHYSGMPVYMHRGSRVCTLAKPYFLGTGNTRRHEIPMSAIPCLAYRRALLEEEKQKEIDREIEEQIKSGSWQQNIQNNTNQSNSILNELNVNPESNKTKHCLKHINSKNDVDNCKTTKDMHEDLVKVSYVSNEIISKDADSITKSEQEMKIANCDITKKNSKAKESETDAHNVNQETKHNHRSKNKIKSTGNHSIDKQETEDGQPVQSKASDTKETIDNQHDKTKKTKSGEIKCKYIKKETNDGALDKIQIESQETNQGGLINNEKEAKADEEQKSVVNDEPVEVPLNSNKEVEVPSNSARAGEVSLNSDQPVSVPLNSDQPVSVPLNSDQPVSVPLNSDQPVSVPLNSDQPVSVPLNSAQAVSVPLNSDQPVSVPLNSAQPVSVPLNSDQPVSVPLNSDQPVSVPLNSDQPVSVPLNSDQPVSVPLNSAQAVSVPLNSDQPVSVPLNSAQAVSVPLSRQPVVLPGGRVMAPPRVETVSTSWKTQHLTHEQVTDYCRKLFKFKTVNILHFKRWADRRKYTKARKTLQYPTLPEGTKLITIPAQAAGSGNGNGGGGGKATKRDWVMNMSGRSYLSVFHEYVRRALQAQPVYEFRQLENAATPYQATVYIGAMQYGVGRGSSKRAAKSAAARASIHILIPEMRADLDRGPGAAQQDQADTDFTFFDYVGIEDPRISEFCAATCEPSPHATLRTCLLRNFGANDRHIHTEMKKLEYQKISLTMSVGKHSATVVCKNKKTAKQRASQAILQALHPHVQSWGSLLRLYGSRSVKSCKEKKLEEQQITLLQDAARHNEPNYAVLDKLRQEMRKLRDMDEAIVPIGTLLLRDDLPTHSGSNLNNVDL